MRSWMSVCLALLVAAAPFAALEYFARRHLFDLTTYTQSEKLDVSWRRLASTPGVNVAVFGSSEALYGIDPAVLDRVSREHRCSVRAFNLGIEGFGPSFYEVLLNHLDIRELLPDLKVALIVVNMIEPLDTLPLTRETGFDCKTMIGELQRSVFTSPFGQDHGLAALCRPQEQDRWWKPIDDSIARSSAAYRYRASLRTLVLDQSNGRRPEADRRMARVTDRGFYEASDMTQGNYGLLVNRWKTQIRPKEWGPPPPPETWSAYMQVGGILDRLAAEFRAKGVVPIFVAAPTNPMMIDDTGRRAFYVNNAKLLSAWVQRQGIGFVDTGPLDGFDPRADFEDHRHTSAQGARKFTAIIANSLAGGSELYRGSLCSGGGLP